MLPWPWPDYPSEGEEVLLLAGQERLRLEERKNSRQEIYPVANHQDERSVTRAAMVLPYPPAAQPGRDKVEDLSPLRVLADVELRYKLPSDSRTRVTLYRDVKRSFSVDVAGDVGIQSFLLIDRTRHFFTAHATTVEDECVKNE